MTKDECEACQDVCGRCTECQKCMLTHCACNPCQHGRYREEECVFCRRESFIDSNSL